MNEDLRMIGCMFLIMIFLFAFIGIFLYIVGYPYRVSLENKEQFCLSRDMSLSREENGDYCFDGFEKMYLIKTVGYEKILRGKIETDFKLVKEVVTLE